MGIIPLDLTTPDIEAKTYLGIVQSIEYQVKVGEKWNKEGTQTTSLDEMLSAPIDKQRIHIRIYLPDVGQSVWHDLYMMESARGFLKDFCRATGVELSPSGFDIEQALNKEVMVDIGIEQSDGYEPRPRINKIYKP